MTSVSFVPSAEVDPTVWDDVVDHSDDAWLFHRSAWLAAESVLSGQRGLLVRAEGRVVGVCPLIAFDLPVAPGRMRCLASGGHFASGPAFRADLTPEERKEIESRTFGHLRSLVDAERFDLLLVRLPSLAPAFFRRRANPLVAQGLAPFCLTGGARYWGHAALTRIADLSSDRETWLSQASPKMRKHVRAAERKGLHVEVADYASGWRRFRALQEETYRRTGAAVWPLAFFEKLETLRDSFRLYFARGDQGGDGAALWVARHGPGALYLASATHQDESEGALGAALQFRAMEGARADGCRYYQIGPHYPFMDPRDKMRRIGEFKRRLGGEDWPLHEGTLVRSPVKVYSLLGIHLAASALGRRVRGGRSRG